MPRAMAEISHQLPDVALLPFPVIADKLHAEPWWTRGTTMKLMFSEYLKYVVAQMCIRLDPGSVARAAWSPHPSAHRFDLTQLHPQNTPGQRPSLPGSL